MKPRVTISLTTDGDLEIWLNEDGRDLLARELQSLGPMNDHFHLGRADVGEVALSSRPYRTTDKLIECGKILFRTDEWDKQHYPHVLSDPN